VTLLVADSGVRSSTRQVVGDVRRRWQAQRQYFEELFASCGRIADAAHSALQDGRLKDVGRLMNENQTVLEMMTVSSSELERLIAAARSAGAAGAKLSGAGRGGNMIALVNGDSLEAVKEALLQAGAQRVMPTTLG
jgi:mevalonate kinase